MDQQNLVDKEFKLNKATVEREEAAWARSRQQGEFRGKVPMGEGTSRLFPRLAQHEADSQGTRPCRN